MARRGAALCGLMMIAACKSSPPAPPESAPRPIGERAAIYPKPATQKPPATPMTVADATIFPEPIGDYVAQDSVVGAGAIRGRVVWQGPRPTLAPERVTKDQRVCGAEKSAGRLVIDAKTNGVANALVWLSDIRRGKKLDALARASLGRKHCEFVPHVQVVPLGATLDLSNDDPVLHNAHAYLGVKTLFNVGMTTPSQKWHKPLHTPGLVEVKNDAGHPFMTAFVMVAEHPYYAVTDARGSFALEGVPAGTYTLRLWHEGWRVVATNPEGRAEYDAPRGTARRVVVSPSSIAAVELALTN